jgi:hypothetical protein
MGYEQDQSQESNFEDLKVIIKELLFNGANRSVTAKFNLNPEDPSAERTELTPLQLL